jgi:hypothetical protein
MHSHNLLSHLFLKVSQFVTGLIFHRVYQKVTVWVSCFSSEYSVLSASRKLTRLE